MLFKLIWKAFFRRARRVASHRPQPSPYHARGPSPSHRSPVHYDLPPKKRAASEAELSHLLGTFPKAKVVHVIDGDTVIVDWGWRQIKIRLDSIDCPEDGQHWGDTARYGLIKLIGGRYVRIEEYGQDDHGRTLATIYVQNRNSEWMNVNERMVTLGHAWVMRGFYDHLPPDRKNKLNRLERWARSKKVGLWRTPNPVPPWQWRKRVI